MFEVGNQFWKQRSKHGRDKLFSTPELLKEACIEYFNWCDNNPEILVEQKKGSMNIKSFAGLESSDIKDVFNSLVHIPTKRPYTYAGLTNYLGVSIQYFNDFADGLKGKTDELSNDFSFVCTYVKQTIYDQKFVGASVGYFNANIIARDLGLTDKQTITVKKIGLELEQEDYQD